DMGRLIRDLLADQQRPVSFQTKLAEPVQKRVVVIRAGAVLLVVFDDFDSACKVALFAAFLPEWRVQPRVEFVVNAEEVADVVPLEHEALVVLPDDRGGGTAVAV